MSRSTKSSEKTYKSPKRSHISNKSRSSVISKIDQSILEATPRGGGYLCVSPEMVKFQCEVKPNQNECKCRGDDSDSECSTEEEQQDYTDSEECYPCGKDFNIIGNVITVVMLLASKHIPNDFQLKTATNYLELIQDEQGNTPPNIQGLLNHMDMIAEGCSSCCSKEERTVSEPKSNSTVVVEDAENTDEED